MAVTSPILHSFLWKYLERSASQAMSFIVSIVLARLLAPEDFGLLALVMVFILFANVFVQSGLNTALVQKKDASNLDFSTVFWLSLTIAVIVYAVLFFTAPLIADFYENENLIPVVRVLGITLLLGPFNSVQEAYIQKHFLFKKLFFRSLAVIVPSGIFGILLAYFGFGIWALVWQQLANAFLMCFFMLFMVPWKPALEFSVANAKKLFSFGGKLLTAQIINSFQENLHNVIIGKIFFPATLAFYNRGSSFPNIIINNVNESLHSVLFPALSSIQEDRERVKNMTKKSIILSTYIITPMMAILAVVSESLVEILLGEKWLPAVPFMQIYCFIYALWPLHTTNLASLFALGKSGTVSVQQVFKLIFHLLGIVICILFFKSAIYLALIMAIISCLGFIINAVPNKKLIDYGFFEQIMDILPNFLLSLLIIGIILPLNLLKLNAFVAMFLQVFVGIGFYIAFSKMFKIKGLIHCLELKGR
jgi:O-antigen/teichoic acid export membrane protein